MHARCPDQLEISGQPSGERSRVAIRVSIDGDLRYISHHDQIRMLVRALTRAGWPVAYSHGFNPHPRLVLPLPRSVGTASACEWAFVELAEARPSDVLRRSLAAALPPGCHLRELSILPERVRPQPRHAVYTIELDPEHAQLARTRILELLAADSLVVERDHGPGRPARAIDIRPYIETVDLDERTLRVRLAMLDQRTARPTEVLTAMHLPGDAYIHRVRRVAVEWNMELASMVETPASTERTTVDQEDHSTQAQAHQAYGRNQGC